MSASVHLLRGRQQAEGILWRLLAREQAVAVEEAQRSPQARILTRALSRIHNQRAWPLRSAVDTLPMPVACAVVSYARHQLLLDPCFLIIWIERHEAALLIPDRLLGQPEPIAWARSPADVRSWLGALQADGAQVRSLVSELIDWL